MIRNLIDNPKHSLDASPVSNLTKLASQLNVRYWSFMLGGMVNIPLCLSFADLQAYAVTAQDCLLTCGGNPPGAEHVRQSRWQGVALADLLAEVTVQPQVQYAHLYAADGYTTCVDFADLHNALLAFQLDDQPLTAEQGFPARLIVPGLYGYKMPKTVQHIILSDEPLAGTWEKRGWPLRGQIVPTAAFISPRDQAVISGPITLQGYAIAGERALTGVEISVDDGPWMPVPLPTNPSNMLAHWSIDWQPPAPGWYRLHVRAAGEAATRGRHHALVVQVSN